MASRAPGWIDMEFDHLSIKIQLENGLKSSKLDSYEIWLFFNWESIEEWPQELQGGFLYEIWSFSIKNQL